MLKQTILNLVLEQFKNDFYRWCQSHREDQEGIYSEAIREFEDEFLSDYNDNEIHLIKPELNDIIDNVLYEDNFTIVY